MHTALSRFVALTLSGILFWSPLLPAAANLAAGKRAGTNRSYTELIDAPARVEAGGTLANIGGILRAGGDARLEAGGDIAIGSGGGQHYQGAQVTAGGAAAGTAVLGAAATATLAGSCVDVVRSYKRHLPSLVAGDASPLLHVGSLYHAS